MALQIAKNLELATIASASADKHGYAKAQGADHVIDYRNEDIAERVKDITSGKGVNIVLNPISGETLRAILRF